MPTKQATHTNKKLIVFICGVSSQYLTFYFNLGLLTVVLALVASCGAFVTVHFSDQEVKHDRGGVDNLISRTP